MVTVRIRVRQWLGMPLAVAGMAMFALGVSGVGAGAQSDNGKAYGHCPSGDGLTWTKYGVGSLPTVHSGVSITLGGGSLGASFSSPVANVAGFSVKGGMPEDSDDVRSTKYYAPLEDADTVASTVNRGGNLSTVSNVCIALGTVTPTTGATTTTTGATTTTTAVSGAVETTTTTAAVVAGTLETTTTRAVVKGIVVENETPRAAPEELAFTGAGDRAPFLVVGGLVLMMLGIATQMVLRRRTAS